MAVTISAALLNRILAQAERSPDSEICGLLWGDGAQITRIELTRNVAPDPGTRFEIDPRQLFAAIRAQRVGGERLVGHYHSHPNGSALPSAADLAASEPGKLWLIVAGATARLWLAEPHSFSEVQMIVNQDCA
ncbi:MAG TPA: M67 family metallopeptidase [Sphingomonas sp.]|nr:M67 family metallopeptidase [Sphingomonas sp.]